MKYLYRVVYRLKPEHWHISETENDHPWETYISSTNPTGRPYMNAAPVKGIVTAENHPGAMYEYKCQRFPLTQEWEDM